MLMTAAVAVGRVYSMEHIRGDDPVAGARPEAF